MSQPECNEVSTPLLELAKALREVAELLPEGWGVVCEPGGQIRFSPPDEVPFETVIDRTLPARKSLDRV